MSISSLKKLRFLCLKDLKKGVHPQVEKMLNLEGLVCTYISEPTNYEYFWAGFCTALVHFVKLYKNIMGFMFLSIFVMLFNILLFYIVYSLLEPLGGVSYNLVGTPYLGILNLLMKLSQKICGLLCLF